MSRYPACWRCSRKSRIRAGGGASGSSSYSSWRSRSCRVLAGAKNFREIGDQAADLPQDLLARLGGTPHPLRRQIIAPSEKRIRTLLQALDAAALDEIIGGWLRALAAAGRLETLLTAIAIDGKWLRGVADGQVKLFAAMLHEEKVIIAQHRIPDDTNEITQVRELLDPVDLTGAVVTADAAHAQHDTAEYIAGGRRRRIGLPAVRQGQPARPAARHLRQDQPRLRRRARTTSAWTTPTAGSSGAPSGSPSAGGIDFPHAAQVLRIRRDTYDLAGAAIAKEIVHAVTSLDAGRGTPADPGRPHPRASGASNRSTGSATPPTPKTPAPATPATAPRSWPP